MKFQEYDRKKGINVTIPACKKVQYPVFYSSLEETVSELKEKVLNKLKSDSNPHPYLKAQLEAGRPFELLYGSKCLENQKQLKSYDDVSQLTLHWKPSPNLSLEIEEKSDLQINETSPSFNP